MWMSLALVSGYWRYPFWVDEVSWITICGGLKAVGVPLQEYTIQRYTLL